MGLAVHHTLHETSLSKIPYYQLHLPTTSLLLPHRVIHTELSAYFKVPVVPGKTLLFLDEIQACPNAIHSLWFFKEDYPELHVVAAGSLLEFALKDLGAYGVGRIRSMFVYPMSFDEFLYALGEDGLVGMKRIYLYISFGI